MIWIVGFGIVLTMSGVMLLGWCVLTAWRARRAGLDGTAMAARLKTVVAVNLGALALSVLGLMTVIVGLLLG